MDYDLAVIGAGWAGFNAALRAKDAGLKVCLIEKADIGGTCLNRGCIPTKSLIQSAKLFSQLKKSANFGIESSLPSANFLKIQERKDNIVRQLRAGMQSALKGVDFLSAQAQIISVGEIKAGGQFIKTKSILIACGSGPQELAGFKFDGRKIISSDDILNLKNIPPTLLIIGGGVIGCEFASLFAALGAHVTIVEFMPQLLPGMDKEVAKKIETAFKKRGIKVNTNTRATPELLSSHELVLVCVGRKPFVEGLGLEACGVKLEKGRILVDEYLRTNIPGIFASGDCVSKTMLAHFAAYQGIIAAGNIIHPDRPIKADNTVIPGCIFTDPEIASVGLIQEEAEGRGMDIKINKFDFLGSGMARILDETEGFIKVVSDKKTETLLGAFIIGPKATELIAIFTVAITNNLKLSQLRNTIFAHPSLSESIHEAVK
ncbi:MAG: dihydrolipoyl dehydrogenase [Candidatus Omnitrophica bacterium]|nr:dihydrolipoyl dehydrogenase [Candidatus Omnitrophota bacterium]